MMDFSWLSNIFLVRRQNTILLFHTLGQLRIMINSFISLLMRTNKKYFLHTRIWPQLHARKKSKSWHWLNSLKIQNGSKHRFLSRTNLSSNRSYFKEKRYVIRIISGNLHQRESSSWWSSLKPYPKWNSKHSV